MTSVNIEVSDEIMERAYGMFGNLIESLVSFLNDVRVEIGEIVFEQVNLFSCICSQSSSDKFNHLLTFSNYAIDIWNRMIENKILY